jgi:hypothetical protein
MVSHWDTLHEQLIALAQLDPDGARFTEAVRGQTERLQMASQFQNAVLHHLVEVGLPITYASFGMTGFKYHSGFQENPHPACVLPPWVELADGERLHLVHMQNGRAQLTPEGHRWLTDASLYRGT